jgi:signal transduction histidine kinase
MPDTTEAFIQLLRKMGHDMRVPLNTLISTTDMLVEGAYDPLTPKQSRAAVRLQRNSRRLLAILDDFVTYMKADAGDLLLTPTAFDPRERLKAWCDQVRSAADEKQIALNLIVAETVPASLVGDESIISRIVLALLWNALAYTTRGEIRLTAEWTPDQEWLVCVQDTGAGILPEDLRYIFEPFWRGVERPQMPTAGAGLGLPLSLALAKLMGGTLVLKQTGALGSMFCVTLPLQAS